MQDPKAKLGARLLFGVVHVDAPSGVRFDLPDRNTADLSSLSLLTGALRRETNVAGERLSTDAPSWFLAGRSTAPNDGDTSGHDQRDRKTLWQGLDHHDTGRRTRIRSDHHCLESPIAADDLCTWLELLTGFAGTDLLRLKAIVSVVGRPGPVLLYGEQNMFNAPQTLPRWPTGDHRTRITLLTRNLNEDCLRDLLAILTQAASPRWRSNARATQLPRDRATGRR